MKACHKLSVFLIFIAFLAACTEDRTQRVAGETVEKYHELYNEQNYEEIFNSAHEEARRTKSKEGLGFVLAESYRVYGKHLSSELVYSKVKPINEKERQVELAYKSKFENGTRNETFLIVTNNGTGALHSIGELSDEELEKLKANAEPESALADENRNTGDKPGKLKSK